MGGGGNISRIDPLRPKKRVLSCVYCTLIHSNRREASHVSAPAICEAYSGMSVFACLCFSRVPFVMTG